LTKFTNKEEVSAKDILGEGSYRRLSFHSKESKENKNLDDDDDAPMRPMQTSARQSALLNPNKK